MFFRDRHILNTDALLETVLEAKIIFKDVLLRPFHLYVDAL